MRAIISDLALEEFDFQGLENDAAPLERAASICRRRLLCAAMYLGHVSIS
jgi:hypothetical protein